MSDVCSLKNTTDAVPYKNPLVLEATYGIFWNNCPSFLQVSKVSNPCGA